MITRPSEFRLQAMMPAGSVWLDAVERAWDLAAGTHLVTPRRRYSHHGIYVGLGHVVHYAGWCRARIHGPIEEVTLADFAAVAPLAYVAHPTAPFAAADVVARARSRLGEDAYDLLTNNCEHFCNWCIEGRAFSAQVEALRAAAPRWVDRMLPRATPNAAASCGIQ
jgi:hypothetical protein